MARPVDKKLKYFPFDVNFFDDDKIQLLESEYGWKGTYIYIRLLGRIYQNSFYCDWDKDICLLFAKRVGCAGALVDEIVNGCLKRFLFDQRVLKVFGKLTSKGIQERYFNIMNDLKRKVSLSEVEKSYLCITSIDTVSRDRNGNNTDNEPNNQKEIVFPELMPVNSELMPVNSELMTQKKENKNKGNEIKINESEIKENILLPHAREGCFDSVFFRQWFLDGGWTVQDAEAFYNYYESIGWKNKAGLEITNRISAAKGWCTRNKNQFNRYPKARSNVTIPHTANNTGFGNIWEQVCKQMEDNICESDAGLMACIEPISMLANKLTLKITTQNVFNILENKYIDTWKKTIKDNFGNACNIEYKLLEL